MRETLDLLLYEYFVWLVTNAFHHIFLLFFLVCCRILFPVLLELGVVICLGLANEMRTDVLWSLLDEALRFGGQSAILFLFLHQCTGAPVHMAASPV